MAVLPDHKYFPIIILSFVSGATNNQKRRMGICNNFMGDSDVMHPATLC